MSNKPKKAREINTKKVSGFDVCQSPPHSIEPLLPLLDKKWVIWESAAGPEQILARTFADLDYDVIATDLLYGEEYNYFAYTPGHYDIEITNIPFSLKYLWIQKAVERNKPFAFLVPFETGAAGIFQDIAAQYDTVFQILAPERRINYKMPGKGWNGTAQMPTCWLTWQLHVDSLYRRNMYLEVFKVPMRNVKYNDDNTERKK